MNLAKIVSAAMSVSAIALALASNSATAANTQQNETDSEHVGNIPTFHYSISAEYMMELLMMDIRDRRQHMSKAKPSYLDSFIVRTENVADGISGGGFANNSGQLCATIVTLYVSLDGSSNQGQSSMAERNCAMPGGTTLWSQWVRGSASNPTQGLTNLYKTNFVTTDGMYDSSSAMRAHHFRPISANASEEIWGQTLRFPLK